MLHFVGVTAVLVCHVVETDLQSFTIVKFQYGESFNLVVNNKSNSMYIGGQDSCTSWLCPNLQCREPNNSYE